MHRLLKRQLKKIFGETDISDEKLRSFVHVISDAYNQFDADHKHLERILELSAKESFSELNNFRNAIDAAAIVSITDANGNIIYTNENFEKISGYSKQELIGNNHRIINSGYHTKAFWNNMWSTISKGEIWKGEVCNKNKNGNKYWVNTSIIPFLNVEGKPNKYLSIRFDISARKQFEDEINRLALVAKKTQNIVIITDTNGLATWANPAFEKITGFKTSDLLNKKPGDLLQGPLTKKETIAEIGIALRNKTPYNGEILNYRANGETYWISLSITPIIEKEKHLGFIAIESDITAKKRIELTLKRNEELLLAINKIAGKLLVQKDFYQALSESISIFATLIGADRINIYQSGFNDQLKPCFSHKFTYEKNKPAKFNIHNFQNITYEELNYTRWYTELSAGNYIGGKTNEFPAEEREQLEKIGINSVLIHPIFVDGNYWGFIGFDIFEHITTWSNNEIAIFANLANTIGSAFERYFAEEKLRENEEKFRLLIESATDIFYNTDENGNFKYVNDIATKITGFSQAELLSMNYLDLVQPEFKNQVARFYQLQSLKKQSVTYNEFPIVTKTGEVKWVGQNVQLIYNKEKVISLQAIARDITNVKLAQNELLASKAFLNNILDSISNPVFVKNRSHEWKLINKAFANLIDKDFNDIINKRDDEFLSIDEGKAFIDLDEKLFELKTGSEVEGIYKSPKSGKVYNLLTKKSYFKNNNQEYIVGVITDITVLKQNEAELQLLNKITEQISDAISVSDYNGKVIYVNQAQANNTGFTTDQIIGKSVTDIEQMFKTVEDWQHHFNEVKEKGELLVEGVHKKADGTSFPVEANVKYLNIDGLELIAAAIRDISERKKIQKEITDKSQILNAITNNLPVILYRLNQNGIFMQITGKGLSRVKLEPNQIKGLKATDVYNEENYPQLNAQFKIALSSKEPNYFISEGYDENGKWYFDNFTFRDETEDGAIIGFALDITERKLAEENLKESEERLKLAIGSANLGIWDWDLVTNNLVWDESMYKIFNVNPNQFSSDYDAFEQTLHPDDKERVNNEVTYCLEHNIPFTSNFRILANNEVKYIAAYSKTFYNNKKPIRLIGVNYDITDAKLAEERIKKQQKELEEAQRIAKVGGWEYNYRTKVVSWTQELYNLCEVEEQRNFTLEETLGFFTDSDRELVRSKLLHAIQTLSPFEFESELITAKGKLMHVRCKGLTDNTDEHQIILHGIIQDITNEKIAQEKLREYTEELEKKNKELDQFAYVVSHDLKAPLRGINNLSMWIEEDLEGKLENDTKHNLDLLRNRVKRMENLIDGILQYSRAGRIKHNLTTFNLNEVIKEIIESLSASHVKFLVQPNLPTLTTERIAIEQIFTNYLSNAVKYNNNPEPVVEVSYCIKKNFYEFCVSDNGPGIAKEFHEKVFVIFQTLQARDTYESTGVGLAIVKKMVEEKGGAVWIESDAGLGAKFYFSWPVIDNTNAQNA